MVFTFLDRVVKLSSNFFIRLETSLTNDFAFLLSRHG